MSIPRSQWTVDTLHALMDERDKRYEQRFQASENANRILEASAEKWRLNANEWRAAMNDREANFLSKGMGYVIGGLTILALFLTIFERIF